MRALVLIAFCTGCSSAPIVFEPEPTPAEPVVDAGADAMPVAEPMRPVVPAAEPACFTGWDISGACYDSGIAPPAGYACQRDAGGCSCCPLCKDEVDCPASTHCLVWRCSNAGVCEGFVPSNPECQ